MRKETIPTSSNPPELPAGRSDPGLQLLEMLSLPVFTCGALALGIVAFLGMMALPVLVFAWVGSMWLALSNPQQPISRLKQLGTSLAVAVGLIVLFGFSGNAAYLAGRGTTRYGTFQAVDFFAWHIAALGPALLISWMQRLRTGLGGGAWGRRVLYWFAFCPFSAAAGALLARAGLPPDN